MTDYLKIGALYEGQDEWVAVRSTMKDAKKDYIQVGDVDDTTGTSFMEVYKAWPEWADILDPDNLELSAFCYVYTSTAPVQVASANRYCSGYM